jgi:hypothetical protein
MVFLDYGKLVQIRGDLGFVLDDERAATEAQLENPLYNAFSAKKFQKNVRRTARTQIGRGADRGKCGRFGGPQPSCAWSFQLAAGPKIVGRGKNTGRVSNRGGPRSTM